MNDGVTVCIGVLRSIFDHLEDKKRIALSDLDTSELLEVLHPYARVVGQYFAGLSADQLRNFRGWS
jgi:hypothetical protein